MEHTIWSCTEAILYHSVYYYFSSVATNLRALPVCIHTRWGWTSYNLQYLLCISTDKHSPHYQQHRKAQAKKPRRDIKLFANLAGCDPTVMSFCHYYYYKCANATVGELRAELRTQNGLFGFTVSSFCTATWQRPLLRCLPQDTATLYGLS